MSDNQLQLFDFGSLKAPIDGLICPDCQTLLKEEWRQDIWMRAYCDKCRWDVKAEYYYSDS